jgi:hypothetical protein
MIGWGGTARVRMTAKILLGDGQVWNGQGRRTISRTLCKKKPQLPD